MDELLILSAGRSRRMEDVLSTALAGVPHRTAVLSDPLRGRRILFAVAVDAWGPDDTFLHLLRALRARPELLRGAVGGILVDGADELYTKEAARLLALAANGAGCLLPGKPLVEATGSLQNLEIQSRRLGLSRMETYRALAGDLCRRLLDFTPPTAARPQILMLHASDHKTSNTLALGGRLRALLEPEMDFTELSLRNGTVHDCRGCSYTVCAHYAQQQSCFYGGSVVEQGYPAILRCSALMLLCPNYNDSVSANIMAFINRLTSLQLFHSMQDKYLCAVVVSGYSGSDLVAQQVLGALCLNKGFILPPRFCLMQTANDPGAALAAPGIDEALSRFAGQLRETMLSPASARH